MGLRRSRGCQVCPDGWAPSGAGCLAPPSYQGPCGRYSTFNGYRSQAQVDDWVRMCGDVSWSSPSCFTRPLGPIGSAPAAPAVDLRRSRGCQVCPDGWAPSGAGCLAPPSYQGPCGRYSTFNGYRSQAQVDDWVRSCGDVSWSSPSCYAL